MMVKINGIRYPNEIIVEMRENYLRYKLDRLMKSLSGSLNVRAE